MATLSDLKNKKAHKATVLRVGPEHVSNKVELDVASFIGHDFVVLLPNREHEQIVIQVARAPFDLQRLDALHISVVNEDGDPINAFGQVVEEPPSVARAQVDAVIGDDDEQASAPDQPDYDFGSDIVTGLSLPATLADCVKLNTMRINDDVSRHVAGVSFVTAEVNPSFLHDDDDEGAHSEHHDGSDEHHNDNHEFNEQ